MVRNRNPCLVEAQRGFCETHHIFMKIVLPAELTECKAEFFTRLYSLSQCVSCGVRKGRARDFSFMKICWSTCFKETLPTLYQHSTRLSLNEK